MIDDVALLIKTGFRIYFRLLYWMLWLFVVGGIVSFFGGFVGS